MSLRSRLKNWFIGAPEAEATKPHADDLPSRHERREAGRQRHHKTGEPAWQPSDKVRTRESPNANPDAAPEILGG